MACSVTQLRNPVDDHLISIDTPQPFTPNDYRGQVFLPGGGYSSNCWAKHLGLHKICWANSRGDAGKGVAITPRHVLCAEHGAISEFNTLTWYDRNNQPWSGYVGDPSNNAVYSIGPNNILGVPTAQGNDCRLLYLDRDIPPEFICKIANPTEL